MQHPPPQRIRARAPATHRQCCALGISTVAAALLLCIVSGTAQAQAPTDFRRSQVYAHPSFQMSHFVGELADPAGWGVGIGLTQGAQFGPWGFSFTLDTNYFLTEQDPLPFNRGLQLASIRIAFRYVYPLGALRIFGEAGLRRVSLISNALVELTGPELAHHGLGGSFGLRLAEPAPLYFEVSGTWDWLWDLPDSSLIGISLGIGIRSLL